MVIGYSPISGNRVQSHQCRDGVGFSGNIMVFLHKIIMGCILKYDCFSHQFASLSTSADQWTFNKTAQKTRIYLCLVTDTMMIMMAWWEGVYQNDLGTCGSIGGNVLGIHIRK